MKSTEVMSGVLASFGIGPHELLGRGGEASVFALDEQRVLRVPHADSNEAHASTRRALLDELAVSAPELGFSIPRVLELRRVAGTTVTVEARCEGTPLAEWLRVSAAPARRTLVHRYLDAVSALEKLAIVRPWFGDLLDPAAIRTPTFRAYLRERAARSLSAAGHPFSAILPDPLALALPEPESAALVYLDAHPDNVLVHRGAIAAIIDFGSAALIGDARLGPLCAAAYLSDADQAAARDWIRERGLDSLYAPARRWVGAYWAFARDNETLASWCWRSLRS